VRDVSGLLLRLNATTRQWHAEVDEPWLGLIDPTVTRADYLAQLVRTYGFVAPFESACKYTPGLDRVLDFRQLTRAGMIAQDLLALGLSPSQVAIVPQCCSITTYRGVPEALGWLYVIERATLLHHGIRRHLLSRMPDLVHACAYLSSGGDRAADQWAHFGRLLDRAGAAPEDAEQIFDAAHDAFHAVAEWFRLAEARRVG
jgi:heme oxygenase